MNSSGRRHFRSPDVAASPAASDHPEVARGSIPLYFQLERVLRSRLQSEQYPLDGTLPGEVELCREFGVSRSTVRQALATLQREGLIARHPGRGTFPRRQHEAFSWQLGSIQDIFDYARETKYRLLSRSSVEPPPAVAQLLKTSVGTKVMQYRGVRSQTGLPFVYTTTWLPMNLGEQIRAEEIRSNPIVVLIESLCGIQIGEVQQHTTAIPATREVAQVLNVPVRCPILLVKRLYFSREGIPVDFAVNYFAAQRFEYHERLMRFRS